MNISRFGRWLVAVMLFIALIALVVLAPSVKAVGDGKAPDTFLESSSFTNKLTHAVTETANLGSEIYLKGVDMIGLQLTWQGSATGNTNNLTLTFARTLDHTNYESTPKFTWVIPLNGATTNVAYTNFGTAYIGAAAGMKVVSAANGDNGTDATNVVLKIGKKTF